MKRFWLVLLALGLVMSFSASVFAADVKFTGSYYAAGMYLDKTNLTKNGGTYLAGTSIASFGAPRSTAFYYQRLRVNMEFIVTPYLKLVTRFDAMERAWGAARGVAVGRSQSDPLSSGTTAENENIAFDLMYVQYLSKIGLFRVGYQDDGAWGTVWGDSTQPLAKITYMLMKGPVAAGVYIGKFSEGSATMKNPTGVTDRDFDMYAAFVNYTFKADKVSGMTGLLWKGYHNNATRGLGFQQFFHVLIPYAKAKFGPVAVEAEVIYGFGKYRDMDAGPGDVDLKNWAAYLDVLADFGMFYVGATGAWMPGDDPTTTTKIEGNVITGGADWNPCLIMFNYDLYYWAGQLRGHGSTYMPGMNGTYIGATTNDAGMTNAWFGQIRAGVRPIADLDIMASVSYAKADEKYTVAAPGGLIAGANVPVNKRDYGWEIDVTATYKITNNLTYMLGGAYLFTGDYFEGGATGVGKTEDNFLIINKLTLTF